MKEAKKHRIGLIMFWIGATYMSDAIQIPPILLQYGDQSGHLHRLGLVVELSEPVRSQ